METKLNIRSLSSSESDSINQSVIRNSIKNNNLTVYVEKEKSSTCFNVLNKIKTAQTNVKKYIESNFQMQIFPEVK